VSHFVSGDDGIFLDLWRAPGELAMSGLSPFASPLDGVEGGSPARCVSYGSWASNCLHYGHGLVGYSWHLVRSSKEEEIMIATKLEPAHSSPLDSW
jgi:hypothetical protein